MSITQEQLDQIAAKAAQIQSVGGSLLANASILKKWVDAMSPCTDDPTPPPDPDPGDRPTGTGYTRYEDLYKTGDTVTEALKRLTEPSIVTFPEGRFEEADFTHYAYAIAVPSQVTGIWGSGTGALGEETGTIFSVKPNSATRPSAAQDNSTPNPFCVIFHQPTMTAGTPVYRNFHIEGTDQRDDLMYNGLVIYGTNGDGPVDVQGILSTGWAGNNGAPPGETFGMTIHAHNGHTVTGCTFDGRRTTGGPNYGLTGATAQNSVGGTWTDCHTLHVRNSAFVLYQTFGIHTVDWLFDRDAADITDPHFLWGPIMNHERTAGTTHTRTVGNLANTRRGVHFTHSNPTGGINLDGTTRTWEDGSLTIVDPTFSDIWGNGKLYIQTWDPYGDRETNTTAPVVQATSNVTPDTYVWVHGNPTKHDSVPVQAPA